MSGVRKALEAVHPSEVIREEMDARGWNVLRLAMAMGEDDWRENYLALDMYLAIGPTTRGLRIGEQVAAQLGRAFGTSAEFWLNLKKHWLAAVAVEAAAREGRDE